MAPSQPPLPPRPIDGLLRPLTRFLHIEATSGILLVVCTVLALILANSRYADAYSEFWQTPLMLGVGESTLHLSLHHFINDGLMAIFFFVIGLEIKRELVDGTLSNREQATLPVAAALGGMLIPAAIYLSLQYGEPGMSGWGVPMATDIAFVVGCLALFGRRVPNSLRVLLLSLAIVDDIGAIVVIAFAYTESLDWSYIGLATVAIAVVHLFSRLGVRRFAPYIVVGAAAWLMLYKSGVHATLVGVILGQMTPAKSTLVPQRFRDYLQDRKQEFQDRRWARRKDRAALVQEVQAITRETVSPLEYLEMRLHPWSAFLIMPLFALANAGVPISLSHLNSAIVWAIALGMVLGKPLGILSFCWICVRAGFASLPKGITWPVLVAGSCLAGIGFTMALFIAGLAFDTAGLAEARSGVLLGSAISLSVGMSALLVTLPRVQQIEQRFARPTPDSRLTRAGTQRERYARVLSSESQT